MCFSSGLATTMTITHLLKAGDHIVSMDDVYGGTYLITYLNIQNNFNQFWILLFLQLVSFMCSL